MDKLKLSQVKWLSGVIVVEGKPKWVSRPFVINGDKNIIVFLDTNTTIDCKEEVDDSFVLKKFGHIFECGKRIVYPCDAVGMYARTFCVDKLPLDLRAHAEFNEENTGFEILHVQYFASKKNMTAEEIKRYTSGINKTLSRDNAEKVKVYFENQSNSLDTQDESKESE